MNTIQNKGYLWEKCVEKGLFANIPKGSASKIQTMFESSVERFSEKKEPLDVLNLQFLTEFKDELDKLNSFEARQKEYDEMLKKTPPPIDFSEKKDEPLENIDKAIEQRESIRQVPIEIAEPINWGQVIKTQNDILVQILQTQIKIMNILQKK